MLQRFGKRAMYSYRWLLQTVLFLAITNIAGNNIAVVPVLAAVLKADIYPVILIAYFGAGACLSGVAAWIGAVFKDELPQTVEWSGGKSAKELMTWTILGVCLPASALTGGFFSGVLLADTIGIAQEYGASLALLFYAVFVLYKNKKCVMWINILSFLSVPLLIMGCLQYSHSSTGIQETLNVHVSQWVSMWALVGYNAGGLRPILLTETGIYLNCRGTAVGIAVSAKWLEGLITLMLANAVVESGVGGLMPVGQLLEIHWGLVGRIFFALSMLGIFFSCMVPAMAVNAYQIKGLTGMQCVHALLWAWIIVLSITFLGLERLLGILAVAGIAAVLTMLSVLWQLCRDFC